MKYKKSFTRITFLSVCIVFVAMLFVSKLYYLQVMNHDDFVALADRQYTKPKNGIFDRGSIFFENKEGDLISVATLASGFSLIINPTKITNASTTYESINRILPINEEDFMAKASKTEDPYEEIAKKVEQEKGDDIAALKIPGVGLYKDKWRFYPGVRIAANTIGFVAYKGDDLVGRYGLERQYEEVLERSETNLYANFFVEIFSNIKKTLSKDEKMEGNVVATLEPTVQATLEEAVSKIQKTWESEKTGAVIMNPQNGEILGMAVSPSFDPNNYSKESDVSIYANPLIENVYEMGSIIKPVTLAAGIDMGVITAKSEYFDKGFVKFDTETIYNHGKYVNGQTDMQTVLDKSLNTGAAYVVGKMGTKNFAKYMFDFGLGEKTDIDLPNEAQNIVGGLKSPRDVEYMTASFGQGIAMSPISTVRALSVLGNGGFLVTPHVVKKINYLAGLSKDIEVPTPRQVIKKTSSDEITRMLVSVVDNALLGGRHKNEHYSIAAKTGTAQIAKPGSKGYYGDRYLHSFFGYFPAYNPKFIVFLFTVYPKSAGFAADTLSSPFFDLSDFLINYYEVPPDR
jgi:stage V sporulation protein D (sporulation-specific penicillin-binding protein)